jgi:hypothetical protein
LRPQSRFSSFEVVYNRLILQAYLTTDVYEKNYGGHDTRLWGRVILPLWTAPTVPPTTPMYRKG